MNTFEKQIAQLQEQRTKLDQRLNKLLQKRNKTICKILDQLPTDRLDTATLIGGMMAVCERATQDQTQAEVWRQAGAKFCKARQHSKTAVISNPASKAA
jgi:chromosome segregation ATPase